MKRNMKKFLAAFCAVALLLTGSSLEVLFGSNAMSEVKAAYTTSTDLIDVDFGKDENYEWGTLEQGATKYHSGLVPQWEGYQGTYGELPSYLVGHQILKLTSFPYMTITAKEDCYVYVLAIECKARAEEAGFEAVATYEAGTVYSMEVTLMEKKLAAGESVVYGNSNDNLFAAKEQLDYPKPQQTSQDFIAIDFGKDENHEWGTLEQGATKYHSGLVPQWEGYQGTYGELPSYLVGHQILKLTSFPYMTITAKEDCYVYVLAIECKARAEEAGFEAVATYEAGTVYSMEVTLMEKKLAAGESVVYGNSNDNLFATKEQLDYPKPQLTSQDFIAIDFGKDENHEWGTLEQGATKYHSGLVPQWSGYQGTYGELPSYLVGHQILKLTSFPYMTITAKEDCYVYVLAIECKARAEEAGFEAVATYEAGTVYSMEVTLMEKKLAAGESVVYGNSNDNLFATKEQLAYPQQQPTSQDFIAIDFGKDENHEWGPLAQGATKYHSGLVPQWEGYQGTYGELPSYLVGHQILKLTSFPYMTITAKEDCYVYVLAIECKPEAEKSGFEAVATYEAGTVYKTEVTLMEKKLTAGSSVVFGNSNDNLFATKEQLEYPTILTVGGADTNTTAFKVAVQEGDTLPTGYTADGKYILSWTADGSAVTTYDKAKTNYVAKFVDTKMLAVAKQHKVEEDGSKSVRFISTLDKLEGYEEAGFVFANRDMGEITHDNKGAIAQLNTAYSKLNANGTAVTPEQTGVYDAYSNFFIAYSIKNIPAGQNITLYARAYVIIDGVTIYGDMMSVSVDALN